MIHNACAYCFTHLLRWSLVSICCGLLYSRSSSSVADDFTIHMVLWRGLTSADTAFRDTVQNLQLTKQVRVWNAVQNHQQLQHIKRKILAQPPDLLYLFGTTVTLAFAGPVTAGQPSEVWWKPPLPPSEMWETHPHPLPPAGDLQRIPMLFNVVADPVGSGISKDYGPTGRNLTGVSHSVPLAVQAKIMHDLQVKNITALFNPEESNSAVTLKALHEHLRTYNIALHQVAVKVKKTKISLSYWHKLAQKLRHAAVARGGLAEFKVPTTSQLGGVGGSLTSELVYIPSDSFIITHADDIIAALHQAGMPTFSATEEPINESQALMGVISHYAAAGRQAGLMAERILRHKIPVGTIPIATPVHYLFLVNEDSMRQLAYYPPVPLLQFAEFTVRAVDLQK